VKLSSLIKRAEKILNERANVVEDPSILEFSECISDYSLLEDHVGLVIVTNRTTPYGVNPL